MKTSHSLKDTMSSGVHSWNSQADEQSNSWSGWLHRGRQTDTPTYFDGKAFHCTWALNAKGSFECLCLNAAFIRLLSFCAVLVVAKVIFYC